MDGLENINQSKVSKPQKTKNHMFSLICGLMSRENITMLLDLGPTTHMGGMGLGSNPQT
jgi:hypothetical protein